LVGEYGIQASRRDKAPGVYVDGAKIAALGLRVRNGCTYHGLALNVNMDLAPYNIIDPCGYPGLAVTDLFKLGVKAPMESVGDTLLQHLARQFGDATHR
jgi:lipoyl(octanoyl) transferase